MASQERPTAARLDRPGVKPTEPFIFVDRRDGFQDARTVLGGVLAPHRILLHEVKKPDVNSALAIARIYLEKDGITTGYYADELGVHILPGLTVIDAAVQVSVAAALGYRDRTGTPVINRARLSQEGAPRPNDEYIDLHASLKIQADKIKSGRVEIKGQRGDLIGIADNIGGLYLPKGSSGAIDTRTRQQLKLLYGFDDAHSLLRRTYTEEESSKLDFVRLDEDTSSGTGILLARQNRDNAEYFRGINVDRISDMDLATAAVKLIALIALRDQEAKEKLKSEEAKTQAADRKPAKVKEPDVFLPIFTSASFESFSNIPMSRYVTINASVTNTAKTFRASAVVLNEDGIIVASVSEVTGRLATASSFTWGSKEKYE